MIEQIDDELVLWVKQALGDGVTPTLDPPTDSGSQSIHLYLLEVVNNPFPRSGANAPYQPTLRYLVTTYAQDPREAHRLLTDLLYAAMQSPQATENRAAFHGLMYN